MKEAKFKKVRATLFLLATGIIFISATEIIAAFYEGKGVSVPKWVYYPFMALGLSALGVALVKFREAFSKHS